MGRTRQAESRGVETKVNFALHLPKAWATNLCSRCGAFTVQLQSISFQTDSKGFQNAPSAPSKSLKYVLTYIRIL